ncbi:hypothetical protein [Streptacidiphilus sp. P02-A3a]|uniref:hypothetical protein n=1 Tax=Streptacidiphilus sp. P02-A3a TaxID=2704468 RepID=UPI0015FA8BF5|nr:hypothetical protein [Streptacidiphilus sp. P02-A3a]QMU72863.1 hypothetical protein GXP74_36085 [Streptacidiphilus sp. P02-A3a]
MDRTDPHARIAFCKRVYRAYDRITTALDPERVDRRRRLPLDQASAHAAAWEDTDPEHLRRRTVLQQVSDAFVLAPVRHTLDHGWLKGWPGDVGVDMTGVPAWHHPPSDLRQLGSVETTGGWHFSAVATEGAFGHCLTLTVAASRRSSGKRVSRHPQLALGAVLDTGGKRPGPNAVHTLTRLAELDLPSGILAADRAYTDQTTEHFQTHVRRLGYQLALDYKQEHRGIQGTHHGALLIDGSLACPLTPHRAATATTTNLDDQQIHAIDTDTDLQAQIAARRPFHLKVKQHADPTGTIRLQCPAAGPSPSITCPRFNRLHPPSRPAPGTIDLTDPRAVAAHPAAKPATQIPTTERLHPPPPDELPRICRQPTITIRPGDLVSAY